MSQQLIKALNFKVQDVGKHVKGSKKRYQWTISLKGKVHTITMDFSFISGKVKIVVDNRTLLQNELPPNVSFQYPFTLDGFSLNCIQQGQTFQLRINNKVFTHLYNQEKTKVSFKTYEEEVKDISVNQSAFHNSSKTVKLSIGAFGGKKKNVNKAQSDNWGSFGKEQAFPSFFGQQDSTTTSTISMKKPKNLLDDEDEQTHHPPLKQQIKQQKQNNQLQSILDFDHEPKQQSQTNNKQGIFQFFDDNPQSIIHQHPITNSIQSKKPYEDQFKNMESMFATMSVGNTDLQKTNEPNPMDFFSVNMSGNQQVNVQALKQNKIQIPKKQSGSLLANQQQQTFEFNTMQNLFTTNANSYNNQPQQYSQPQQQINIGQKQKIDQSQLDFNTMQLMFKTNANPNAFSQPQYQQPQYQQPQYQQPQFPMAKKQQVFISESQPDDFNTMKNLFNTYSASSANTNNNAFNFQHNMQANMQKKPSTQQPIFDVSNTPPSAENYSTLQNFFQTISNPSNQQVPTSTQKPSIDPNNSQDIFKSMGLNLQEKPKVPMNTMGGGMDFDFQTTKGNTYNTTQGAYMFDFSKKNSQGNQSNDLL